MLEFPSFQSFWKFSHAVGTETRFVLDAASQRFLEVVAETSRRREHFIDSGIQVYRARLKYDWSPVYQWDESSNSEYVANEEIVPVPEHGIRPQINGAVEGRANPKGIPVFYAANDLATAVAEVRPWVGAIITYGVFVPNRRLRLVNCADNQLEKRRIFLREPDAKTREACVWHDIDEAFSRPVTRSDEIADYVPTQILAEIFRREKFDGITFRSSVSEGGVNLVIFDRSAVNFKRSNLVEITKLSAEFKERESGEQWF